MEQVQCSVREIVAAIRSFVYLAYFDDSKRPKKYQVMAAVLLKDSHFAWIETVLGISVKDLLPEKKLSQFREFHAWEIYGGYGVFEGVEQAKRHRVIMELLMVIRDKRIPVIYGAVDLDALRNTNLGSASALNVAFLVAPKA